MIWNNIPGATYDPKRTQIFSSGGGVQSAAITALIVLGELPRPDLAVIVDTEREKSTTWKYLESVTAPALARVGIEIHRVKKSDYATFDLVTCGKIAIPAFTSASEQVGKLPTYCSGEWKTRVMQRWATRSQGVKKAQTWIGFSVDEIGRAARMIKPKPGKWGVRFPLLERNMDRNDCLALVKQIGWPAPPRSSCWMCPNMHMREWREIMNGPDRDKVVDFERKIRLKDPDIWLTDQCKPVETADFSIINESMWGDSGAECDSGQCFI
ncbi:MAG: hypothetical protein KJ630_19285 [Proteobacteria bacterium]|nr:hypothetical protein [Pseudomonadota bacterium]